MYKLIIHNASHWNVEITIGGKSRRNKLDLTVDISVYKTNYE